MNARDVGTRLAAKIEEREGQLREAPVTVRVEPREVRDWLASYDFTTPRAFEEVFDDVDEALWRWTEHARHPMHFGLFRPNVSVEAVAADALAALYDPNLATWRFAPAANEIERHVLGTLARVFGIEGGMSHFTSGGQEANFTAVTCALTHAFPDMGHKGLRSLEGAPVFYVSEEGHHSLEKVAHATGLGREALRAIPVGDDLRMDPRRLREAIARDRAAGALPFLVVGTAGTTNAGILDPLEELASVAEEHGLWFHVDAAWGGAAYLSERLRPGLKGLERADSITCDAHKWLSVPVGAGMFFSRHADPVRRSFEVDAAYVPPQADDTEVPFITSMQWSRRFIGLKLFLRLATAGMEGVVERIEHQARMGERLRSRLQEEGWVILNSTPLPVVCFTHPRLESGEKDMQRLVEDVCARGEAWISTTRLRREVAAVRACIANFETEEADVDRLVEHLEKALRRDG